MRQIRFKLFLLNGGPDISMSRNQQKIGKSIHSELSDALKRAVNTNHISAELVAAIVAARCFTEKHNDQLIAAGYK